MSKISPPHLISVEEITRARHRLRHVALHTPLQRSTRLSEQFGAEIYFKREDLQEVRSYKIRGAYNNMALLTDEQRARGVVCASAGNHSQGMAQACFKMKVKGTIYMPAVTPQQKVKKAKSFGKEFVTVVLTGDTYDDAYAEAMKGAKENGWTFVHPFNDHNTIAGQGTVGLEILDDANGPVDYVLMAVGGGGLSAGVGSVFAQLSPKTAIIGVEPAGAPAMYESLRQNKIVKLDKIDSFVDGAAVRRVGDLNFPIVRETMREVLLVDEGLVCRTMLELYNEDGLVVEPAGSLSVAALSQLTDIQGKTIVCVIGGGNNDIARTAEIQERALLYAGLKHYFIIEFPQRAGALRDFLNVLGDQDDITHFEYTKKHNRAVGPALVGIQLAAKEDYALLEARMLAANIDFKHINDQPMLFEMFI
ncbi:threonine ammonia-lyase [Neolewinella lacunae]|uniref:L-threonine dehydratase n=1 Tax=Neolewinella lacunae TaxID=1517758 RepID=A0A923PNU8_9BACT|nr:threonine ammonia-lyase [Neolewinella lacunae]MBC6994683.1 threonine ammonia-lyase [Neolewinella lacunae]MDN3634555.1 threonine ammonia-lyase [Neolewinella lacunae]